MVELLLRIVFFIIGLAILIVFLVGLGVIINFFFEKREDDRPISLEEELWRIQTEKEYDIEREIYNQLRRMKEDGVKIDSICIDKVTKTAIKTASRRANEKKKALISHKIKQM